MTFLVDFANRALPRSCANFPALGGVFKACADDFVVEEIPAYLPAGAGEHLFLWVEKRNCAAPDLLTQLARAAGVRPRDVGLAGSKDATAVTRQWASVPAAAEQRLATEETRQQLAEAGINVLAQRRHGNKLRLGHLRGNRFGLRVRQVDVAAVAKSLAPMLEQLRRQGMPNFYGHQRFGPAARNVERGLAWLGGPAKTAGPSANARRFLVSAVQSALFNAYLATRLQAGDWRTVRAGDVLQVVRSGGPFWVDDVAREQARVDAGEVVATGPMFGRKMRGPRPDGAGAAEEAACWAQAGVPPTLFASAGALAEGTRRALWIVPQELTATVDESEQTLQLSFVLPPGSYATVLLAELGCAAP